MTVYVYQNTDSSARVWGSIQKPDGSTLSLGPGETAELDVKVKAVYLELQTEKTPQVSSAKTSPSADTSTTPSAAQTKES